MIAHFFDTWLEPILFRTGMYMLLGYAFLVLFKSGMIHLGLSFQLTVVAIGSVWTGAILATVASPSVAVLGAAVAGLALSILAGWLIVWLRCRFNINDVFLTLAFAFAAPPISTAILLQRKSTDLLVATPQVNSGTFGAWFAANPWVLSIVGLAAMGISWWWIDASPAGFKGRALASNELILPWREGRRLLLGVSSVASVFVAAAAFFECYIRQGRYYAGQYDATGFVGVVIGLLAFGRAKAIPLAALLIGTLEVGYRAFSVKYSLPSYGLFIAYGAGIVVVAIIWRKRAEKE